MAKAKKKSRKKKGTQRSKKVKKIPAEIDRLVTSIRKFAKLCGVAHVTMGEHIRHPTWPLSRVAPWKESDVDLYQNWRAANMRQDFASTENSGKSHNDFQLSPMMKAQLAVTLERYKGMRLDREIKEGKWLDREEVQRQRIQRILAMKNWALRLPREMTGVMDYLSRKHKRRVEKDADMVIRKALNRMAGLDEGGKR